VFFGRVDRVSPTSRRIDTEKVPRNGKGAQDRGKRPLLYSTLLYTLRAGKVEADLVRGVGGWMDGQKYPLRYLPEVVYRPTECVDKKELYLKSQASFFFFFFFFFFFSSSFFVFVVHLANRHQHQWFFNRPPDIDIPHSLRPNKRLS